MGRLCSICSHPLRSMIDRELAAGTPNATVVAKYGIGREALRRHRSGCAGLPPSAPFETAKAIQTEATRATIALASLPAPEELGGMYLDVRERLNAIIDRAEQQGAGAISVAGLNAVRQTLDSLARLAGHAGGSTVNVGVQVNLSATDIAAELAKRLPDIKTIEAVLDE